MELEFDKEIDAILRKARGDKALHGATVASPHIDADSIAAFAEHALPDRARSLYMEHFADCGGCRKLLSQTILMNTEADAAAASGLSDVPVVAAAPWYRSLFRAPGLAFTMGALVLAFAGVLGYLALQNSGRNTTSVASVAPANKANSPYYSDDTSAASNASAANASNTSTSNTSAANTAVSQDSANPSANRPSGPNVAEGGTASSPEKTEAPGGTATLEPAKPVPAPPPADQPTFRELDTKAAGEEKQKEENKDKVTTGRSRGDDERMAADAVPSSLKKTGPTRAAGPRNVQQNQIQSNGVLAASETRSAGGKHFERRNGVWYDRAYNGQSAKTIKRGTEKYLRLDGGLRSIADSISGTVVIVWEGKAYRIQ